MKFLIKDIYLESFNFKSNVSFDDAINQEIDDEVKLEVSIHKINKAPVSLRDDGLQFVALISIPIELESNIFTLSCHYTGAVISPVFDSPINNLQIEKEYLSKCINEYLSVVNDKIHSFLKTETIHSLPEDNYLFEIVNSIKVSEDK
ncbi:hypothetical protein B9T21_06605 [Wohlfahrtiimonas chitiniclastica]|uniref:hypothetical protein n=1 Tax=Wohlfahrtiimonas chitiniclastica TaxID=400946 RepID=UPI000B9883F6|nr:hypothetical protein [Wohlfahrtiimonas chitiniclastica]OYQ87206.1 hypothetical protein B9T21_06605 [Wohlfahrtiimonas chitiniclastica]